MKLLVVLSIKEHQERVASLLQNAGIVKFSVADITGYKKREESLGWFANSNNAKTNSIMLFSFTSEEVASKAIAEIENCNMEIKSRFPAHAFVMDVELFSKIM